MKIIRKSDGAVFERDDEGRLASDRKGTGWDNHTGTYYGDSIEIVRTGTKGGAPDLYKQYRKEAQDAAQKRPGGFGNYGFGGSQNTKFNVLDYLGAAGKNLLHGMAEGAAATGAFAEDKVADAAGWLFGDKELAKSMKETGLFNSLYHGNEDLHLEGIEKERERTAREMERNISGIQTGNETADRALRWAAKAGGDVSYGIGNALPMAAEALAGGPAAWPGVAESADDLVRMGASVVEKSGVLNTLSTAARNMLSSREYWTAFVSEIGSDYMDALNKGASEDDATAYALATALVNSGIEVGGGIQKVNADPLWKSSIEEGREEIDQGVTGRMMENIFLHRNNPLFSTKDEDAIINPVTALKEGTMGAAVGGILSAGQRGIASAVNNRQMNNAYRDVYGADSAALVQEALDIDPDNKTAQAAKKRLDAGKTLSGDTMRRLVKLNETAIEQEQQRPAETQEAPAEQPALTVDETTALERQFGKAGAEAFVKAKPKNVADTTYYHAFNMAFQYGNAGVNLQRTMEAVNGRIPGEVTMAAYAAGKGQADFRTEQAQIKLDRAKISATPAAKIGKVTFDGVDDASLTTTQRSSVQVLNTISKVTGINFQVFASATDKTGKFVGENGSYDPKTNTIRVDINAGRIRMNDLNDVVMLKTTSHELTHFIQKNNPTAYRALKQFVSQQITDKGMNLEQLIQEKITRSKGELTEDDALDEVVADACEDMLKDTTAIERLARENRSLFDKIRDWLRDFHDALKRAFAGNGYAHKEAQAMLDRIEELQKLWDDALVTAVQNYQQTGMTANEVTGDQVDVKESIRESMATAGIEVVQDKDTGKLSFLINGKRVSHVTAAHIENESAFGLLIKTARDGIGDVNGHITAEEAKAQFQGVADIMNLVLNTQNPEMVWEVAGSQLFSAVKSNSDGQYGTTVDFTTVCRKTVEMITAMSHAMMAKGGGLTKAEVTELQRKLIEAGSQVPCPVCYVFSRWAGVGTILDNMYKFQAKYADATAEEIEARIAELKKRNTKAERKTIRANLAESDEAYTSLASTRERANEDKKKFRAELRKARKAGDAVLIESLQHSIDNADFLAKNAAKQMNEMVAGLDTTAQELSWLQRVRSKDGYKPVPKEILFDMASSASVETFMREYPHSWAYRTTRGPSAGKAILPYSDMKLGDMIQPLKAKSSDGNKTFADPVSIKGEWNSAQQKAIINAIARVRAQNLIGGQRFQSTSDFRYDYALDYIQAFFEAQALGSNMQTYTKIVEFGEMVAKIGGDVNLSVMPRNKGYENGHLIFSSVTGIDFNAARKLSEMYDSAQLILVGINDEHIRLALEDSEETGGIHIGFVIPYHTSGASIEEFIRALVSNLNEDFVRSNYQDYSDVQTDHAKKATDVTEDQFRRRDLRKRILTGGEITTQDLALMERDAANRTDLAGRTFEDLLDVENRALAGDQDAIREYESWSAGVLQDLYDKMWTRGGSEYGVRLNSKQAETVMPHEYWDKTTNRGTAYINGFIFRSYCYNMGLSPRFTGISSRGEVNHGNFRESRGYWKTLIDRAMYANDGSYRDQQHINLSNMPAGMISPEYAETHWGEYKVAEPDSSRAERVGREFGLSKSTFADSTTGERVQYSLRDVDPVQPNNGGWQRTIDTQEALRRFPGLWNVTAEESEVRNPTQIKSTVSTYRKIYDLLKAEGFDGTILDASSGLGYGTRAGREEYGLDVDDIEPYPDASYKPRYTDYSRLNKTYDAIISNAVLNVLPQDQRDALVVKMGEMLNPGGKMYINVRGKDVDTLASGKDNVRISPMEWYVASTGSYQKGFTKAELKAYLEDALGPGYTVETTSKFGGVAVIVTKDTERVQRSDRDVAARDAEYLELAKDPTKNAKRLQELVDEAARAAGYDTKGYHGTSKKFTVFDTKRSGENWGGDSRLGPGLYFAYDKDTALKWTDGTTVIDAWLSMKKPLDLRKRASSDIATEIKKRTERKLREYEEWYPVSKEQYKKNLQRVEDMYLNDPALFIDEFKYDKNGEMTDNIRAFLAGLGYDGLLSKDEIVVFNPNQVKSADPVTYDDDGNVIPLSERFDTGKSDIRYSDRDVAARDTEYLDLAKDPTKNAARLQEMVDEAAEAAGLFKKNAGEEITIYIPDGTMKTDGSPVSFTDMILDGEKLGETRGMNTHFPVGKWVGIAKNGRVVGRVKFGPAKEITTKSPEYKSAKIAGTNYDIEPGQKKLYYPIVEMMDLRDSPRDIVRNGNYGVYQFKSAELITYDNNGNVIPLSKRFDTTQEDIRYSEREDGKQRGKRKSAQEKRDAGEKLTESEFYRLYSAHKLDLRKSGDVEAQIESIKTEGFQGRGGFGNNVLPTRQIVTYPTIDKYNLLLEMEKDGVFPEGYADKYRQDLGAEYGVPVPDNIVVGRYGPRKGEYILLVPKSGVESTKYTERVKLGYRPQFDYEIVQAEYDYQPYYEMYEKAYKKYAGRIDGLQNSERDVEAISDRELLANALATVAQTPAERDILQRYQAKTAELGEIQTKLAEQRALMRDHISGAKKLSTEDLLKARNRAQLYAKQLDRADRELLKLESMGPVKAMLDREHKAYRKALKAEKRAEALRQRYNEKLTQQIEDSRQRMANYRQRRRETEARRKYKDRIKRIANDFRQMLLHPTDSRYSPVELLSSAYEIALMLDTSGEREDTKAKAKFNEQMRRLDDQYRALQESKDSDYATEYDPDFAYMVTQLRQRLAGRAIRDLSVTEMEDVANVLHDINEMLKQAKYQLGKAERVTNYSVGESIIQQQREYAAESRSKGAQMAAGIERLSANTMRNVRRMTGYDDGAALAQLVQDLNEGIRKKNQFSMEANKLFDRLAGKRMQQATTEQRTYSLGGTQVQMTEMQAMQLILSWEREANNDITKHLTSGGVLIPDAALMKKGQGNEAVRVGTMANGITQEDITAIYESMDEWARDYMDAARYFFNVLAQNAINEATMQTKHRRIATTRNYIPFEIDPYTVAQEIEGVKFDATIEGMGMLKSVQEGAANALVIRGLDTIIQRHIEKAGQVYGLAVPIRNYNKAMGIHLIGDNRTARESLHSDDLKLLDNAVRDLQTPRTRDRNAVTKIMDRLQSAFVKSTLLSNVSVTIKQAASYSTAGLYLSQKALAPYQGTIAKLFANNDSKFARDLFAEIDEHTAAHYIRRQGMSLQEAAMIAQDQGKLTRLMDERIKNDALNPLKWIQNMDVATTAALWLATKRQVEMDGTKPGDSDYWAKVTELYNKVIEDTQPMYDVLHRPEIQRTTDSFLKSILMFKTQPLQNAGIIWDAVGQYAAAQKSGKGVAEAKAKLGRAVGSQVASLAVFAVMSFLAYAVKNRLGRYKDEEEELTVESVMKRILMDMASNGAGLAMPLFGSEAYSAIDGIVTRITTGKQAYDALSAPMLDMVNGWIKDVGTVFTHLSDLDSHAGDIPSDLMTIGFDLSALFGIPAENVYNMVRGTVGNVGDWTGHPVDWATDESNTAKGMKAAWENGHYDTAKRKMNALIKEKMDNGKTEKEAKSAVKSSMTSYLKPLYIKAYRAKDNKEMDRVRKILVECGLYDDVAKTLATWVKDI